MVTVPEAEQQLLLRRGQLEAAQKTTAAFEVRPEIAQSELRKVGGSPLTQRVRLKEAERLRAVAKAETSLKLQEQLKEQKVLEEKLAPIKQEYEKFKVLQWQQKEFEAGARLNKLWKARGKWQRKGFLAAQAEQRIYTKGQEALAEFKEGISKFQEDFPEEKLTLTPSGSQVISVESAAFGKTLPIAKYQKLIEAGQVTPITEPSKLEPIVEQVMAQTAWEKFLERPGIKKITEFVSPTIKQIKTLKDFPLPSYTREGVGITSVGEVVKHPFKTVGKVPLVSFYPVLKGEKPIISSIGEVFETAYTKAAPPVRGIVKPVFNIPAAIPTKEGIAVAGLGVVDFFARAVGKETRFEELKIKVGDKPKIVLGTVGELGSESLKALRFTGEVAAQPWEKAGIPIIPSVVRAAPELISWIAVPGFTAAATLAKSSVTVENIDEVVKQVTDKQIKEISGQQRTVVLKEGERYATLEEIRTEVESSKNVEDIRKAIRKQADIEATVAGAVLVGMAASVIKKGATRQIKIGLPTAPPTVQWVREVGVKLPRGKLGTFKIFGYKPAVTQKVTTPFRKLVGLKPKVIQLTRPQIYVSQPVGQLIRTPKGLTQVSLVGKIPKVFSQPLRGPRVFVSGKTPYILKTAKVLKVPKGKLSLKEVEELARGKLGVPKFKFVRPIGKAEAITFEEIARLPKPERFTFYGGKQSFYKVSEKTGLTQARIQTYDILKPLGKRTRQFFVAGEVTPKFQAMGIESFKTLVKFKETTKPFYRATGQIRGLPGTLTEIPVVKPAVFFKATVIPLRPITIIARTAPLKVRGLQYFQALVKDVRGAVVRPAFPITTVAKPIYSVAPVTPSSLTQATLASLKRTTQVALKTVAKPISTGIVITKPIVPLALTTRPTLPFVSVPKTIVPTLVVTEGVLGEVLGTAGFSFTRQEAIQTPIVLPKQISKVITKQIPDIPKPVLGEIVTTTTSTFTTQVPKTATVVIPKVIPKTVQIITPTVMTRPRVIEKVPVVTKVILKPFVKPVKIIPKIVRKKPVGVIPFVRRRGVFRPITRRPVTRRRALKIGVRRVRRTLAASLQIRKVTGEPIPIAKETKEFRPGKREGVFVLVQRARRRLKAQTEVAEIIAARKAGSVKFI